MTAFMQALLVLLLQSTGLLLLGLLALCLTRWHGPAVQTLIGRASLASVALLLLLLPLTGYVPSVVRLPEPTPQQVATLPKREGEPPAGWDAMPFLPSVSETAQSLPKTAQSLSKPPSSLTPLPQEQPKNSKTYRLLLTPPSHFGRVYLRHYCISGACAGVGSWAAVSAALLLWLGVCQWHLTRLRRAARPVTSGPAVIILAALTSSPPQLLTHPSIHSPFLAGLHRPAIFLPVTYETEFDNDALRAILAHELAHLSRRDNAWTLAARLLTALLWPQILLWLLIRRLEQIGEDACDQAVLAQNCLPRAYADCLLSLASRPPLEHRQRALGAGVAPFRSSVGRRIRRILTTKGARLMSPITLRLRLTAAALTLAAALGGAFLISSAPAQTTVPAPLVLTSQEQQYQTEQKQDLQNLKVIGLALVMYEQDYHERMPDAKHWMDQITPYLDQIALYRRDRSVFYDPFRPGQKRYGYAYNQNCAGKTLMVADSPAETVIVFDSTMRTKNASDTGQSLRINPSPSSRMRHLGSNYVFIDGHVKFFRQGVRPSFSLKGGQPTGSEPPAILSVVGTWLCSNADGTGTVLIFSPNGTVEEVGPWPGSSTAMGHSYGPESVVGHSYGHYTIAGPNLQYTLTRVWVEGEKPWTTDPEKHHAIYTIGGDTLTLRWGSAYKSVSRRVPVYTKAMLGLKPASGGIPAASSVMSQRQAALRQITTELKKLSENKPIGTTQAAPLAQARFLAGLTPVQGPGVVVTLTDSKKQPIKMPSGLTPPNLIHGTDINQVVNELKAAGAEAISVNGQRLVATSAVRNAGPTIFVNNTPEAASYTIKAIGDSKTLAGALDMQGGIASQLKSFDPAMFSVQEAPTLMLPAYTGTDTPRYARPAGLRRQSQALSKDVDTYTPKLNILINTEAQHETDTKRQIIERQQALRRVQTLIANLHEPIDIVVDTHVAR